MKTFQPIFFFALLLTGCSKFFDTDPEDAVEAYQGGFVYQANTDIPVPFAHIYFLNNEPSDWLGPSQYSLVAETICDSLGRFDIPLEMDVDVIRAMGPSNQFETSVDVYYPTYISNGGLCKLPLIANAWVKVKAVDVEPLNPEVLYVSALPPSGVNDLINISSNWVIWRSLGDVPSMIVYRLEYLDGTFGSVDTYEYIVPGLDTTEIVIPY